MEDIADQAGQPEAGRYDRAFSTVKTMGRVGLVGTFVITSLGAAAAGFDVLVLGDSLSPEDKQLVSANVVGAFNAGSWLVAIYLSRTEANSDNQNLITS